LALDGSPYSDGSTPKDLIGTAFFAHGAKLLSQIAAVLGKNEEASRYEELFKRVRAAFVEHFVTDDGHMTGGTQTAYVLALHFDLMPQTLREAAARELVQDIRARGNHLSTGFVGTPYLLHVLTDTGHTDVAYDLLYQKSWPSWLYSVTQGATTIWERWDGWTDAKGFQDIGMNSFNHYAYGAVGDWLYRSVAGIDLNRPGYKGIVLNPRLGGGMTCARARLESVHGPIISEWRLEGPKMIWNVQVPANTTAVAYLPTASPQSVLEGGSPLGKSAGIEVLSQEDMSVKVSLTSGAYIFEVDNPSRV
jgi:alpha-L-rhamnosidase